MSFRTNITRKDGGVDGESVDIYEIRRRNLQTLVDEYANGNLSRFVEWTLKGLTSYKGLQHVLGPKRVRNLGSGLARKIEARLQLERGWLDHDRSGTVHTLTVPDGRSERLARRAEWLESLSPSVFILIEKLVNAILADGSLRRTRRRPRLRRGTESKRT